MLNYDNNKTKQKTKRNKQTKNKLNKTLKKKHL